MSVLLLFDSLKSHSHIIIKNLKYFLEWTNVFFKKMDQSRPLFVYFRPFLITISIQIEKSVDGVLGIRIRGRNKVDADETMELWRPPMNERLWTQKARKSRIDYFRFQEPVPAQQQQHQQQQQQQLQQQE